MTVSLVLQTASTFANFLSMMLLNPQVQKKIHAELDQFGIHTFTFEDRPSLPYLDAAWKESMRMNPSSPLGVPHLSNADDMYKGMYLPKGTLFMTNLGYAISHSFQLNILTAIFCTLGLWLAILVYGMSRIHTSPNAG
jgi:cytochrome P450